MRALFLNPAFGQGFCKSARWFARSRGRVQRHPDYMCQAIAVLEEAGHTCRFIDGAAKGVSLEATQAEVSAFRPDMVVIQATTPSIYSDLGYARMCKETLGDGCITALVGAHASAEPDDTFERAGGCLDVIARGEYDYTLRDLAAGIDMEEVAGISYVVNGNVAHNPVRPLIENLDELPFPAWHHIDPYDYPDAGKLYPFITLMGGRGCEGRCTFCLFPQVMYGQHYRAMSPGRVVDEIEHDLELFPFLKEVMFEDDTLTLKQHLPRLRAICEEILWRGIKISWSANARADLRDLDTLKLMKRAGCRMLCVGFEFGNQQILNNVRKGIKLSHMREFAESARKAGIRVHGCFMIGGPEETRETARETIEFAKSLPIDTVQFSGVCAYPGTAYYDWVKENGFLVPQDWPEWVDANLEQRAIIDFPQLPVDEINALVDEGLREFYLRPRQMWAMLRNIRSWADVKTKWHGLMSFLDYFGDKERQ
jgi:anaerobic magnesium-protoporphyrin IX monomethyl ester cyclase